MPQQASIQKVRYDLPSQDPSLGENIAAIAAAGLGGYQKRRATEQQQLAQLLPYFIQQRQATMAPPGQQGAINVGGQGFNVGAAGPSELQQAQTGLAGARTGVAQMQFAPTQQQMSMQLYNQIASDIAKARAFAGEKAVTELDPVALKQFADESAKLYFTKPGPGEAKKVWSKTQIDYYKENLLKPGEVLIRRGNQIGPIPQNEMQEGDIRL